MIIQNHIDEMKYIAEYSPRKFNCWGATQYALGERKRYGWVGEQVMHRWLSQKTRVINTDQEELQVGDVLCIKDSHYLFLIHTAVYYGNGLWFHKRGGHEVSFNSMQSVVEEYSDPHYYWASKGSALVSIHRLAKKPKKKLVSE